MQNERAIRLAYVKMGLRLTDGTPLAPTLDERKLLAQFLRGVVGLEHLSALADDALQTAQAMEELRKLMDSAPLPGVASTE